MIRRWTSGHDTSLVDITMRKLASEASHERASLPDPAFIWWKAQLLRRLDSEEEALAPIEVGDRLHLAVAVIVAVALAAIGWAHLRFAADPLVLFGAGGAVAALVVAIGWTTWSGITGR
jgi:hypothetical protein